MNVNGTDLSPLFVNPIALAVAVAALTQFVKEHLITSLSGIGTITTSLVIGAALGAIGAFAGEVEGGLLHGVAFGIASGVVASGGWDAISALLRKRHEGGDEHGPDREDAARLRSARGAAPRG